MANHDDVPIMEHESVGSGEKLVLLPGGFTGWLSWIPHVATLAESRQVVRLQLHNVAFGLSGAQLPPSYSVEYEAAALGKTLDHLAIRQADIAGWSYGALIALSYAIHNPHRVQSLTLIEPAAIWVLRSRGPLSRQILDEQRFLQTLTTDYVTEEQLIEFMHVAGFSPENVDARTLPQWPVWVKHRQSLRIGGLEFSHEDSIEWVRAFEKPVLLVKGEGSNPSTHIVSMQPFLQGFTRFLSERNPP